MSDPVPNAELLRSLGRLVRGLSALFWGLPIALIACVWTAYPQLPKSFGFVPPLAATGLVVYSLWQLGGFQKQERVWRNALDFALVLAVINFGLSPFVFWWSRIPGNRFFLIMVVLMAFCGLLFLCSVNLVLRRLGAMLPDEALRIEIRQFTSFNLNLIGATFVIGLIYSFLLELQAPPDWLKPLAELIERQAAPFWFQNALNAFVRLGPWFLLLLVLLPLAMTMALIWKTKEVILENVFAARG
jgi:hypothetical protein